MRLYKALLFSVILSWGLQAEIMITFPKGGYTLREVIDRIEHETPFNIQIPFSDDALIKTRLPESLEFKESLFWIARYHEKYNKKRLHFEVKGRDVSFMESFPETIGKGAKVLESKVKLNGRKWSVHDALKSAAEQLNLDIQLPLRDAAKIKSDYNYECTLGELLDEVRLYWHEYNQQRLIYRKEENSIIFLDGGNAPPPPTSLDIELMGNLSTVQKESTPEKSSDAPKPMPWETIKNKLEPKVENENVTSSRRPQNPQIAVIEKESKKVKEEKVVETLDPLPEVQPIDYIPPKPKKALKTSNVDKALSDLKDFEPLRSMNKQQRMTLVHDLIRPHPMMDNPNTLADWISLRLPAKRGVPAWIDKIRALDLSKMNSFEKKAALRGLQEAWLKQTLAQSRLRQGPKAPDQGWHRLYRLGVGTGRYPLLASSHPIRQVESAGTWVSQDLLIDYRFNPPGPWNYGFGLGLGAVLAKKPEELSETSLSFHYQGERHVSSGGIETVSPFFDVEVVNSALSDKGIIEHQLWSTGVTLHWREKAMGEGDFLSSSTFHMSKFLPIGDTRRHFFYPNADLRQDGFGYRHQWSWSQASMDTAQGPHGDVYLVHNKGQHFSNEGMEWGFGLGYHYNQELWRNSLDFGFSSWDRTPRSETVRFEWTSRRAIGRGDGVLHLLHEIRDSNEMWFNGSSTLVELSWEVTW